MSNEKTMTTIKRIHWKPVAQRMIAERAVELLRANENISDMEAVRQAMRYCLPESEWRHLTTISEVKWFPGMKAELMRETPVTYAEQKIIPQVVPQVERQHVEHVNKEKLMESLSTELLLTELLKRLVTQSSDTRIRDIAREEANAVLDRRLPGALPPDSYRAPLADIVDDTPAAAPKHKVCIIGLENRQRSMLEDEYKGIVRFHFLSGSEGGNRIKSTVNLMDFTVKTHWTKGTLGSTKGWPNFTSSTGGMDTIRRLLNERFKISGNK